MNGHDRILRAIFRRSHSNRAICILGQSATVCHRLLHALLYRPTPTESFYTVVT